MKATLRAKLERFDARLKDVERLLAAEDATRNMDQFRNLSREHAEISSVIGLYDQYRKAEGDAEAAKELELGDDLKQA
ncbi:MAG TPA: PCRF domain-containing protein, partial [Burkholderiales bacterium]|nr:PCRF domain-containing protein [Burkholderiales bacterium]